jgi:hypothetical protein
MGSKAGSERLGVTRPARASPSVPHLESGTFRRSVDASQTGGESLGA